MIFSVRESSTAQLDGDLVDETGAAIALASLLTLTATIYDVASGTIINGRNHQSILNLNGGVVSAAGHLAFTLSPADNAVINIGAAERHRILLEWTWGAGKAGSTDIDLRVTNVMMLPAV